MQVALRKSAPKSVKKIINSLLNYAENALRKIRARICREKNVDRRVKNFNARSKTKIAQPKQLKVEVRTKRFLNPSFCGPAISPRLRTV